MLLESILMMPGDCIATQVAATCKHFAAYSLEAADGWTRNSFDADVSQRSRFLLSLAQLDWLTTSAVKTNAQTHLACSQAAIDGIKWKMPPFAHVHLAGLHCMVLCL